MAIFHCVGVFFEEWKTGGVGGETDGGEGEGERGGEGEGGGIEGESKEKEE